MSLISGSSFDVVRGPSPSCSVQVCLSQFCSVGRFLHRGYDAVTVECGCISSLIPFSDVSLAI